MDSGSPGKEGEPIWSCASSEVQSHNAYSFLFPSRGPATQSLAVQCNKNLQPQSESSSGCGVCNLHCDVYACWWVRSFVLQWVMAVYTVHNKLKLRNVPTSVLSVFDAGSSPRYRREDVLPQPPANQHCRLISSSRVTFSVLVTPLVLQVLQSSKVAQAMSCRAGTG